MEFDCEEGDFIGDRNSKRRKCIDDGITTKAGVSLVEQHRAEKRVDLLKRNIKYMVYTNEKKLDSNRVGSIIAMMNQRDSEKKEALRQLLEQNDGVREPNPFKPKKETCESIFTDEDFMNVGPQRVKVPKFLQYFNCINVYMIRIDR
ncbi:unnamed protein product [Toxocara canis]|uniref:Active regulator of SIRT1 n=1 Tax=Toxocara canis TaxID=6265 RepID=A0A183V4J7_TOXCA|nr:unnamed protein product [Toxocara canis]